MKKCYTCIATWAGKGPGGKESPHYRYTHMDEIPRNARELALNVLVYRDAP